MKGQKMLKCRQLRPVIVACVSEVGTKHLLGECVESHKGMNVKDLGGGHKHDGQNSPHCTFMAPSYRELCDGWRAPPSRQKENGTLCE